MQRTFGSFASPKTTLPNGQLLKWIGNKHRFASAITSYFPSDFRRYIEPFLGGGAVLGTMAPESAVASDIYAPLIQIWMGVQRNPSQVSGWYESRWKRMADGDKKAVYEAIKADFNAEPNGADLLFLCRSCYGGVIRFRKADGYMSTPCGPHNPIPPEKFAARVQDWNRRIKHVAFEVADFADTIDNTRVGDLVYCDPPYVDSQKILYGAQSFSVERLFTTIADAKARGAKIALSIDGTKKSGATYCNVGIPDGLFEKEILLKGGSSMLRRLQLAGKTAENEDVADRLLLTF